MKEREVRRILGVLGGMGALASAEFLRSIYECVPGRSEQEAPIVVVYSDPTFPDRTESLVLGADEKLLERLLDALARLREMGASRMVICCMTIHYLLPRLPDELRASIISLPDVVLSAVVRGSESHLLIASSGARKVKLFESHPDWGLAKDRVLFPGEDEQARLHELIFEVKRNRGVATMLSFIDSLLEKYRVRSFIAGCSEMHIVAKQMSREGTRAQRTRCVDPLATIARDWAAGRIA